MTTLDGEPRVATRLVANFLMPLARNTAQAIELKKRLAPPFADRRQRLAGGAS